MRPPARACSTSCCCRLSHHQAVHEQRNLSRPRLAEIRLRPMRRLKRLRSARVTSVGHALVQNHRRGHYEFGTDVDPTPDSGGLRRACVHHLNAAPPQLSLPASNRPTQHRLRDALVLGTSEGVSHAQSPGRPHNGHHRRTQRSHHHRHRIIGASPRHVRGDYDPQPRRRRLCPGQYAGARPVERRSARSSRGHHAGYELDPCLDRRGSRHRICKASGRPPCQPSGGTGQLVRLR